MPKEIPIHREHRTFEQYRRNLLTRLEHKNEHVEKRPRNGDTHSVTRFSDNWDKLIHDWTDSSWRNWDEEMKRMRSQMFALLPLENFGLLQWDGFEQLSNPFSIMDQMEGHIHEIRERMEPNCGPVTGSMRDYLKDAYELSDDGQLHFKLRFDAKGFDPEDISVSTCDNYLTVHAKKTAEVGTSKNTREFCRMTKLPDSIDQRYLQCNLTKDGVLMLEAPVKCPNYETITFTDNRKLGVRPKSEKEVYGAETCTALAVRGVAGLTIVDDGTENRKRIHLEVPVDSIYEPGDVCVNVDSNRIVISGKHCNTTDNKTKYSTSVAEFHQSYEIPETVDPLTVTAQMIEKTVVLEAPLGRY